MGFAFALIRIVALSMSFGLFGATGINTPGFLPAALIPMGALAAVAGAFRLPTSLI